MASSCENRLENFDAVQICYVAISGVVKSVVRSRKQIQEEGLADIPHQGTLSSDHLQSLLYDEPSSDGNIVIDYTSLSPRPWLSTGTQKIGGAMCQRESDSGSDGPISARGSALRIVQQLKDQGLVMKSAYEAEFTMYEADGKSLFNNFPLGAYGRLDNLAGRENLLLDICMSLQKAGKPIETFMSEFGESQYEITFCPEEGVASADSIVLTKEVLKSELKKNSASVSFMACSNERAHAVGFHFNHSLWTEDNKNAFLDENDPNLISDVARHWIAGLIYHSPALTALFCPTVNCFRRLAVEGMSPKSATWAIENRLNLLRVKNEGKNVYIENRLPSAACNPYLALAGTVAAGLDGIRRKLECPMASDTRNAPIIPKSLPDALDCLEKDVYMTEAIGRKIVAHFILMNRRMLNAKKEGLLSSFNDEKEIYFQVI